MSEEELEDLLGIGCCEYHIEIGKKAKKEIERLNNIINEFDKWLEDTRDSFRIDRELYCSNQYEIDLTQEEINVMNYVIDKLKELKENK